MVKVDLMQQMFTVNEVAALFRVSRSAVYQYVKIGKLKPVKVGRRLVIPRGELEKILPKGWFRQKYREVFDEVAWLRDAENNHLFETWRDPRRNVPWQSMKYSDFVAYFHLVVVKKYREIAGEYADPFPRPTWMRKNGFTTFCQMISRYLSGEKIVSSPAMFVKNEREKFKIAL